MMPWFTLLLLLLPQTLSQSTNTTTAPTVPFANVPITVLYEYSLRNITTTINTGTTPTTVVNDAFSDAIWTDDNLYVWTDGPLTGSTMYAVGMKGLVLPNAIVNLTSGYQPFVIATEIATSTGVYDPVLGYLFMFGSSLLYRMKKLDTPIGLVTSNNQFQFPSLTLCHAAFYYNNQIYGAQYTSETTPQLYIVNSTEYDLGYSSNTTMSINLTTSEMQAVAVDTVHMLVALGARTGVLEIRDLSTLELISSLTFINSTPEGRPFDISDLVFDNIRKMLYVAGNFNNYVYIIRLNISDNGASFNQMSLLATSLMDLSRAYAVQVPLGEVTCDSIEIDPYIGVGYVAAEDTSEIGYFAKFDIRSMQILGDVSPPIESELTNMVSTNIDTDNQILYAMLPYSLVIYQYPTSCPNDCTSPANGRCVYSVCNCTRLWTGDDCSQEACIPGCGDSEGRGNCKNGVCICTSNWEGTTCTQRRCPDDCLASKGAGTCGGPTTNYTCICAPTKTGANCALPKYTTCEQVNAAGSSAKSLCLNFGIGCGWCNDDMMCKSGNIIGPVQGACHIWLYDSDLEVFPMLVGAVIIICLVTMFIINGVSALMEDFKIAQKLEVTGKEGDAKSQRLSWWRDERSAKSWKLWDQMQFLSLYTITNMAFSTSFISFTDLFHWTNFALPFPPLADKNTYPARQVTSIDQFGNALGVPAYQVFWVVLFWWGITLVCSLVIFGIYSVVVVFVLKKDEKYVQVLTHRLFHIASRVFLAGYLPICCLAGWAIVSNLNGLMIIPIIFLIVIGIGVPVFNFLVVKGEKTDFLFYQTRIRYGSFYVQFKQDKAKFAFVVYFRKLVLAICFGFLATTNLNDSDSAVTLFWTQILIPALVMLFYIVLLFVVKPYVDIVHAFLDALLNILNVVTLAVSILFRSDVQSDRDAGVLVVLLLQIMGVISVIFAYCYTWMFYAGYNSCMELISGKVEEEGEVQPGDKKAVDEGRPDNTEEKSEKSEKSKGGKKKEKVTKEIDEENLGDLEISD